MSAPAKKTDSVERAGTIPDLPPIPRWRFDKLREASTVALQLACDLLRHEEQGKWLEPDEPYEHLVRLVAVLSTGLKEAALP